MNTPTVVTICGSTRFADLHAIARWEMEKTGDYVCLQINYFPAAYAEEIGLNGRDHFGEQLGLKKVLDELHLRKIDLSDEVYVVNKDGYIGESTQSEIAYAMHKGIRIRFMEEDAGESWLETNRHRLGEQIAAFAMAGIEGELSDA